MYDINLDQLTSDSLCMSVSECAALLGKSQVWVKNAIEQGTLPGSYTKTSTGHRDFHIPRIRIAEYLGLIGTNKDLVPHDLVIAICEETIAHTLEIISQQKRAPLPSKE